MAKGKSGNIFEKEIRITLKGQERLEKLELKYSEWRNKVRARLDITKKQQPTPDWVKEHNILTRARAFPQDYESTIAESNDMVKNSVKKSDVSRQANIKLLNSMEKSGYITIT